MKAITSPSFVVYNVLLCIIHVCIFDPNFTCSWRVARFWRAYGIRNVAITLFGKYSRPTNQESKYNFLISHSNLSRCHYHPLFVPTAKQGISFNLLLSFLSHSSKSSCYHWHYLSWIPLLPSFFFVPTNPNKFVFSVNFTGQILTHELVLYCFCPCHSPHICVSLNNEK